jgi:AraC-like DNA-binding protein
MNYQQYKPPQILSGIVQHYWSLDRNIPVDQTYIHRTLANFCPELIFHYGGAFQELATNDKNEQTFITGVHGQTDRIRRFTATKSCGIFGVILQPYAIPILFGVSSTAIKNELVDLESLLKQDGKDLTDQMMLAKDNTERLQLINRFLAYRLKQAERQEIVYATHQIYNLKGMVNVNDLADRASLSQRQFERKFKEHIGFSAKSFARLVRFKSLIKSYKKSDSTLTKVAYDFGYYDQAHFIQDFKQFTGYSPNAYFSGKAKEVFYAP